MSQGWRHFPFATVRDFHDADTCEVEVDSGFGAYQRVAVRLYGLSAPEVSGKEREMGKVALYQARGFSGRPCQLWTWKQSFTRYVGRIVVGEAQDVVEELIRRGCGRAWDGKTDRPSFNVWPVALINDELNLYRELLAKEFRP